MKKLPPLPKVSSRRVIVPINPPGRRPPYEKRKFRDKERADLAAHQFREALAEEVGVTRAELDLRAAEARPLLDVVRRAVGEGFFEPLSIDEKLFAVEAYFEKNLSAKEIARQLNRSPSTLSRFIKKYKSTVPLARRLLEGGAETLAERVIKKANVTEALEVLDRVDALPKKDRGKESGGGPQFNIIVATPGQTQAQALPIPDQRTIEAARTAEEE